MQTPNRSLNLAGASNFRDIGGYLGRDGRPVRWRRVFRSDHLAGLTPSDAAVLADLGLGRAIDFRGVDERAGQPYEIPGVVQIGLPIEPTVVQNVRTLIEAGHRLDEKDAVRLMQQTYRAFVHDNSSRFADLFGHLLDGDVPLVFHCTAGKDRTGMAAALILTALEVPRPVVMEDYLLTNDFYKRPAGTESELPIEVLRVLWRVQQEFLDAALHAIDADWGSVDAYLDKALHVRAAERAKLAALYLDAPAAR